MRGSPGGYGRLRSVHGMVYLIAETTSAGRLGEHVKIGFTSAPTAKDRRVAAQIGNPHDLLVYAAFTATIGEETVLQHVFHRYRKGGEWFVVEGHLRRFVVEAHALCCARTDDAPFPLWREAERILGRIGLAPVLKPV